MSAEIKRLERQLAQASAPINKVDSLNRLGWALVRQDAGRAISLAKEALQLLDSDFFAQNPYPVGRAATLRVLTVASSRNGRFDQVLTYGHKALSLLEQLDSPEQLPDILNNLASAYFRLGDLSTALEFQFQLLDIAQQLEDQIGYANALIGLGVSYDRLEQPEQALASFEEALTVYRAADHTYGVAMSLNNIGFLHKEQERLELALEKSTDSLKVAQQYNHPRLEVSASKTLGGVYLGMGRPDDALPHLEHGLALARQTGLPEHEANSLQLLGQAYLAREECERAIDFLQQALTLAKQIQRKQYIYEIHHLLVEAYRTQDDFKQALYHYEQFHTIKEAIFNEESDQKRHNLEVLHRTESARREAGHYATLYETEQTQRQLAEVFNEVGQDIAASLDLDIVLERIAHHAHELLQAHTTILQIREEGERFETLVAIGLYREEFINEATILGEGITGHIAQSGQAEIVNDPEQDPRSVHVSGTPQQEEAPVSMLCAPISSQETTIGLLLLYREQEDGLFTISDLRFVTGLSRQAAIAINNARLYAQIRRFNEQLEQEVADRTEDLRQAYEQLERIDRTKSDFITVTAHELRTPITILQGYAQLLDLDISAEEEPEKKQLVEGIVSGTKRMYQMVETMLTMVKVDSQALEFHPEPVPLSRVAEALRDELAEDLERRQQTMVIQSSLDHLPAIIADPEAVLMLLRHIVINAIKYTPDGGRITLHGRAWQTPPQPGLPAPAVDLIVTDTGIGIDPEAQELIFNKFYQTGPVAHHSSGRTKFKGGGPGLGLAIARGIVQAHNGRLWVESEGHDESRLPGSSFHIVLPQEQSSE